MRAVVPTGDRSGDQDTGRAGEESPRRSGHDDGGGLEVRELPDPIPTSGEIRIEVAAAGVNRADLLQRSGRYPPPAGASPILGLECSGLVAECGPGVSESDLPYAVGDPVCALLSGGGYAEQVTVPADQVLPLPAGVDLITAAGLPEAICTVWSNLILLGHLAPGQTLLVHGGGSGIGTMAIQVGAAVGARVLTTVGTAAKAARCIELGAEAAIVHTEQDFVAEVVQATDGHGADVILDIIGAAYLQRNVEALATGGRLVVIGLQLGRRGELDLAALLTKRAAILATTLRSRPPEEKATIVRSVGTYAWPMIADGRIRPVIDQVLPFADAEAAHRILEERGHFGKLLLTPDPEGRVRSRGAMIEP